MSYLYVRKQRTDILSDRLRQFPKTRFLLDSGAHTLQVSMDKEPYKSWKLADFETYLLDYVKWLKQNRHSIHIAVELDIPSCLNTCTGKDPDHEFGHSIVERWRRDHFKPLEKLGMRIVYVWHGGGGLEGFEKMCAEYSYVGLPGELSSEKDFNKYITIARRYTTPIHGFASTKQSDFRDWPWASVDSITWKTSEIYGTLIVWDEHRQKLKFEQDKAKRGKYARIMRAMGFDADAIVKDTNYREVTRFALRSMTRMEEFYSEKYKHRIFYYELRLPHPDVILRWKPGKVWKQWAKYTPSKNFQQHTNEDLELADVVVALRAISAIQNWVPDLITKEGKERDFIKAYFASLLDPVLADPPTFKKELAMLTAPPNPPPIPRTLPEHYEKTSNPPKSREPEEITFADLIPEPERAPFMLSDFDPYSRITFKLETT